MTDRRPLGTHWEETKVAKDTRYEPFNPIMQAQEQVDAGNRFFTGAVTAS